MSAEPNGRPVDHLRSVTETASKSRRSGASGQPEFGETLRRGAAVLSAVSPAPILGAAKATHRFATQSVTRALFPHRAARPEIPACIPTPGVLAKVFAEEFVMNLASNMGDQSVNPFLLERTARETRRTIELLGARGMLDNPVLYHQAPPAPRRVVEVPDRVGRLRSAQLSFESGYSPMPGMPGGDRWLARRANRECHARVLRHDGHEPRPWLIYLHGYNMGSNFDLKLIEAAYYHHELGFNVLAPMLPLHGPRRETTNGTGLFTLDWVANVHGLTQSVWDVRRWMAWVREQEPTAIAVHGISLGAYTAALTAGLEPDLDCVVAGLPAGTIYRPLVNAATKFPVLREAMHEHELLGANVEAVHRVVAPTAMPCVVPRDRRFIYAGLADRVATPSEPYQLWMHWEEPTIFWRSNTHLGSIVSKAVRHFVREAVTATVEPGPPSRRR